jgi:hypothetical protein
VGRADVPMVCGIKFYCSNLPLPYKSNFQQQFAWSATLLLVNLLG